MIHHIQIKIETKGKGLYEFTEQVQMHLEGIQTGLANLFVQHTSASLLIQENADPTAKQDLVEYFERAAPSDQDWHKHTAEGPDDTTAHMKAALTNTNLSIPVADGNLVMGRWQGIYLFEHRESSHKRNVVLSLVY